MEYGKILIGSISYAIKAKRLLAREGITANVVKETDKTEGCSNGLSFSERDAYRVTAILSQAGIGFKMREADR
ncbi:MAG: DUF3343 domain-containing protein [Clostridia bacterium]|nr:DUF3343 domain-containing protein [Clostridia bacterium]